MSKRIAEVKRKTKETDISVKLNLDGKGNYTVATPDGFFTHMLELFSRHSLIDLEIKAKGDVAVDLHHTVEDVGICLGQALGEALAEKKNIIRFGSILLPMDEALAEVSLDLSGRPYLVFNVQFKRLLKGGFDFDLVEEFFRALVNSARITLHINLKYGKNNHHISEAIFKGFGFALRQAVKIEPRIKGIPSTKGRL